MGFSQSRLVVSHEITSSILVAQEGLSFWGGVDPQTGIVIDAHHHLNGQSLSGKIVLMPTSRGSCSGSGVLLDLALNGAAPAALIFKEDEEILTLGALIAQRMFSRHIGVVNLREADYHALSESSQASISKTQIVADELAISLEPISQNAIHLSTDDRKKLEGKHGAPVALAMGILTAMAATQGAQRLIDVSRGHIDGCIYAHEANLIFAEKMAKMGAQTAIPTTINAISVERERWQEHDLPPRFGDGARRLADAYVQMGARSTFTCAPYLLEDSPEFAEDIGWSESNAVIFANTVLGARTAKHPDYLDLFIAMTGRAPETGVYLTENRRAKVIIDVVPFRDVDDAFWPLLGWLAGREAPDCIPLLRGVSKLGPRRDDLQALCAAFGTTSAAPMLHIEGITPEWELAPSRGTAVKKLSKMDFLEAWETLNSGPDTIDLVAIGSPHVLLETMRDFAELLGEQSCHPSTKTIITLGRSVRERAHQEGLVDALQDAGVQIISDLCWCSISEPIFPPETKTLMTNSGKYAHYAPGLSKRAVRFGSLKECAHAALTGKAHKEAPIWFKSS